MAELVTIALILLFGTLCSALAYRLKVSNVFFLVLAGMLFGMLNFIDFNNETIIIISELALIMVVFDATSRLNFKEVLKYYKESVKITTVFLFFILISVPFLMMFFFENIGILAALLFSVLMYGIDPTIALSVLKGEKNRIVEVLEIESILNTPLTLIFALIILKIIKGGIVGFGNNEVVMFLQQFFVPVGVGVVLGAIIVHIMKHNYFQELSHLMVITSAIITYVLAEIMNGNGVLAVTTFGLIFGNYHIKHKLELEKFASIFANTLEILVFVLLGTVIVNYASIRTFDELIFGTLLFFVYLIVRYITVWVSLKGLKRKEILFMTLNVPKGIDVAIVILLAISSISNVDGITTIINISLLFVLYSIVVSTVSSLFNDWFFSK